MVARRYPTVWVRIGAGLLVVLAIGGMLAGACCCLPSLDTAAYGDDAVEDANGLDSTTNGTSQSGGTEDGNQTQANEEDEPHDPPFGRASARSGSSWQLVGGCAYAREPIELEVELTGWRVDQGLSTVAGIPLEELLGGNGQSTWLGGMVTHGAWVWEELEGGVVRCTGTVVLASGCFEDGPLTRVVDGEGCEHVLFTHDVVDQASRVAIDREVPSLQLKGVASGAYVRQGQRLELEVHEDWLGPLVSACGDRMLASIEKDGETIQTVALAYDGASEQDSAHTYHIDLPVRQTHEDDGTYVVYATLRDLAGNESAPVSCSFTVDTTCPELQVTWSESKPGMKTPLGTVFGNRLTARVSLRERNLRASEPESVAELVKVDVHASYGGSRKAVRQTSWQYDERSESFVLEVSFVRDGAFTLELWGRDQAGNVLVGTEGTNVDATGRYTSERMIVDLTKPGARVAYAAHMPAAMTHGGEEFFNVPVVLEVTIEDRNLDEAHTVVTDSLGRSVVPAWTVSRRTKDGTVTYRAALTYREERTGTGCGRKRVVVHAVDLAAHEVTLDPVAFVVDQTAPALEGVSASKDPAAVGRTHADEDPFLFFNELDGVRAALRFEVSDEYALRDVWMEDPDHTYDLRVERAFGKRRLTFNVDLVDAAKNEERGDAVFDRDVRLFVRDLAGNVRIWTLDRKGHIRAQRTTSRRNPSIYGDGIFPQALIKDTTAPRVTISGATEHEYYREDQTIHIDIEEQNLSYLQRFQGMRTAATITKRAGNASGETVSLPVDATDFRGSVPLYRFSRVLSEDGHYTITAQLEDYAGNLSNITTLQDVTIDKTPPQVSVTWDNDDVRNGSYYRAGRTATITVTEHNFADRLVRLDTNGVAGAWGSQGDVHTLEVHFGGGDSSAKNHLSVLVRDLAGNESSQYAAPEFYIDTQMPTIEIVKRVSTDDAFVASSEESPLRTGTAFGEACMPIVRLRDEAHLDSTSVEVTIEGKRERTRERALVAQRSVSDGNEVEVDWGNLGLDSSQEEPVYLAAADDVYTISAKVADLAGNEMQTEPVVFSVNRFGSNFYCEPVEGRDGRQERLTTSEPLTKAPRIVIHEINVSGSVDEAQEASHVVTKEHADATSEIARTERDESSGYTLTTSHDMSEQNPVEGWVEYCYTVAPGNFGRGSDSDFGDGGQGMYRVDVSSVDKAGNHNTTARFWDRSQGDESLPKEEAATVAFTLDEDGPAIEDVVVPQGLCLAHEYQGSFRVADEITQGERIEVLVDGRSVPVWPQGSHEPLDEGGHAAGSGVFLFVIPSRSILEQRVVEIRVADYTGLPERMAAHRSDAFCLTDGVAEGVVCGTALILAIGVAKLTHGALVARRKGGEYGRSD